ncbi:HI0074 family nucleotidyltransferase substrate-binding subunit [Sphingomonas sp. NCPPB 2930]
MSSAVPAIDLAPLRNAFSQLSEALMLWEAEPAASVLKRHLRAAAIQSFEFTYELSLRMMRRVLIERSLAADLVQDLSFNDLLRAGADAGLLGDQQAWRRWRAMRNATSHTYDESKAQEVAESLATFTTDALALMQALTAASSR